MLYQSFLDGSGKLSDSQSGYVVLANLVIGMDDVEPFTKEWGRILRQHSIRNRIEKIPKYVKASEARRQRGQFAGWDKGAAEECLCDLATLIRAKSVSMQFCSPSKSEYSQLPEKEKRKLGNLNELAFEVCLTVTAEILTGEDRIYITCDDEDKEAMEMYGLLKKFKIRHVNIRDRFVGIAFVDDRAFPCIQAADLVASAGRIEFDRRATGLSSEPSNIYQCLTNNGIERIEYRWDDPGNKSPRPFKGFQ